MKAYTNYYYDSDDRDSDAYYFGERNYRSYYEESLYQRTFSSPDGFDESTFSIKAFQFA